MPCKVKDVPGCSGCPLFQTGEQNFVPDELREGAEVMVLGQNPGADEEAAGRPFIGQTGRQMDHDYLPAAGLSRDKVSVGNAIRCRWNNSNKLPEVQSVIARQAVEHCTRAHLRISDGTVLLVAQGGYALLALTGHGWASHDKVSEWRGWMLPQKEEDGAAVRLVDVFTPSVDLSGYRGRRTDKHLGAPVLATFHLSAINYDPRLKLPTKADWQKVRRYLHGTWPKKPPEIRREIDEDLFDWEAAWDTEFVPETSTFLRFSAATGGGDVYCVEAQAGLVESLRRHGSRLDPVPQRLRAGLPLQLKQGVWSWTGAVDHAVLRIFFQNADADLPYLARIFPEGIVILIEDEMLAHSVLHGGFPHSLDYQASIHASINRHKHLDKINPVAYSAYDALTQYEVWRATEKELASDPDSARVYRDRVLPLVPIIQEAEDAGILIDQAEVAKGVNYLQHEIDDSTKIAQAAAGYRLNLGSSQQVGRQLFEVENLKAPRGRR